MFNLDVVDDDITQEKIEEAMAMHIDDIINDFIREGIIHGIIVIDGFDMEYSIGINDDDEAEVTIFDGVDNGNDIDDSGIVV
jgi:hypothetical protein